MSTAATTAKRLAKQAMDLSTQRRMAMSIFGVGKRKVWLDPSQRLIIAKAKTREAIRELIAKDTIRVIPTHRGKDFGYITSRLAAAHPVTQRIKKQAAEKAAGNTVLPSVDAAAPVEAVSS